MYTKWKKRPEGKVDKRKITKNKGVILGKPKTRKDKTGINLKTNQKRGIPPNIKSNTKINK